MYAKQILGLYLTLICLAVGLIFFRLGDVPHGMTVDEAAIGYNGYAVITARRDEWLQRLPISFKSFGDFKAPLAIYINGLFTVPLGMQLWVVRLPFALSGVATVVGMIFLGYQLYKLDHPRSSAAGWSPALAGAYLAALTLTTPWFLHFARTGFESGMALMFLVWGMNALLFVLARTWSVKTWLAVGLAGIWLVASMYTYHSSKFVVPVLAATLILIHWERAEKRLWQVVITAVFSGLLLIPLVKDMVTGQGGQRFSQTSIFSTNHSWPELLEQIGLHISAQFDPRYLMGGLTTTLRHGDGQWGILLPVVFVIWAFGLISIMYWKKNNGTTRLWLLGILWTVIGVFPAVIGTEVPHSNRALLALPGVLITALLGVEYIATRIQFWSVNRRLRGSHGEKNIVLKAVIGALLLCHGLFFVAYLHHYYSHFAQESASDFRDGYLETFAYLIPYEKQTNGQQTDLILFTTAYSHPYIYGLFARRTNPIEYHNGSFIKYQFTDFLHESDLYRPHTIVVTAPTDGLPIEKATKVVSGSDGQPRFMIFVNDEMMK